MKNSGRTPVARPSRIQGPLGPDGLQHAPAARLGARQPTAIPEAILPEGLNLQDRRAIREQFFCFAKTLVGVFEDMGYLNGLSEELGFSQARRFKYDERALRGTMFSEHQ